MSNFARSPVTAVLGPTNTGKTHLAVERMCAHSSGIMGFPLRLLAREIYDRVVAIKGADSVGLITGEEKILPANARWLLCTAESMPLDREAAFLALDEAQLGADPERGHVFTDRLLRARGREETMLLGSDALRPMLKALVPDAEIIGRPRFSTLSYAGAKKLSRLPRRSAIVAFSAEEVYAVAETLRRLRGGTAVVMGALSPRTRNAQVQMFQSGEVDYLVATDAIGMGLNLDVTHVAFAGLHKFDGRRRRRLTVAEMAQIAGRAGRHQRDGTFGALHEEGPDAFTPEEVMAIEGHHIPRLDHLFWRDGAPDLSSLDTLIAGLEARPEPGVMRAAPQAIDLAVLKRLADEDWVRQRARGKGAVNRLWAACGLPDFRKLGVDPHARFVGRIFSHLTEGSGHIPHPWFAGEIAKLDNVQGDVEMIAARIAAIRSWAYIAHRDGWLADPMHWAERTRAIEEKLSDALHDRLTQRFVDRRTSALLRQIGSGAADLPVEIGAEGEVMVDTHQLGTLNGFRFTVAADARASDKRMLLAAAEKRLGKELARRADALAQAKDEEFALDTGEEARLLWQGVPFARLKAGLALTRPRILLDRALDSLEAADRATVEARAQRWVESELSRHCTALTRLDAIARDPQASPALRAVAAALGDHGGLTPRDPLADSVAALSPEERRRLRKAGITIGVLDIFDPRLMKPAATRWRHLLFRLRGDPVRALPPEGATVLDRGTGGASPAMGFRAIGGQAVRMDLIERISKAAHDARQGRKPFAPDPALAVSIGLKPETLDRLMARLGFRATSPHEGTPRWIWRGRPAPRREKPAAPRPENAFAALADLDLRNG